MADNLAQADLDVPKTEVAPKENIPAAGEREPEPQAMESGGKDGESDNASNSNIADAKWARELDRRASEDGLPPKELKAGSGLQIIEQSEQWVEKGYDFVFDQTKIIIRQGDSVIMATTDKRGSELKGLDLEPLERIPIPPEHFCPEFKAGLTRAPTPLAEEIYVKKPRLFYWHPGDDGSSAALILQEADVCEILNQHPHPNIAQYHGCLVKDGRITGLCLTNYKLSLKDALVAKEDVIDEAKKQAYAAAIEDGIYHLHGLRLAHNDINPSNVIFNEGTGNPVIIDFDSCRPIGEKLGEKAGTFEWELEEAELSEPENDFYGSSSIREVFLQLGPENKSNDCQFSFKA
ncbi:uncharacterized protein DNG_07252 [Cephalotrichum gorgonifer]|uniref:Protein kinase domain-containing protein n=1 Tax=Cephalotrichum gorgonifer TaxID=2041049 RepID=A0AAE8N237_9PEZI|nr:uncharacterized protein DNG_07252 [Cephalotrichum gorgonifer]